MEKIFSSSNNVLKKNIYISPFFLHVPCIFQSCRTNDSYLDKSIDDVGCQRLDKNYGDKLQILTFTFVNRMGT